MVVGGVNKRRKNSLAQSSRRHRDQERINADEKEKGEMGRRSDLEQVR